MDITDRTRTQIIRGILGALQDNPFLAGDSGVNLSAPDTVEITGPYTDDRGRWQVDTVIRVETRARLKDPDRTVRGPVKHREHACRAGGTVSWCRESCTACAGDAVRPCNGCA